MSRHLIFFIVATISLLWNISITIYIIKNNKANNKQQTKKTNETTNNKQQTNETTSNKQQTKKTNENNYEIEERGECGIIEYETSAIVLRKETEAVAIEIRAIQTELREVKESLRKEKEEWEKRNEGNNIQQQTNNKIDTIDINALKNNINASKAFNKKWNKLKEAGIKNMRIE